MKRFVLFVIFLSSIIIGYSQRTAKVSATYTYYAPETMSVEEAKRVALDRAKIQAIADEFGTVITQNNNTIVSSDNCESDLKFFSHGWSEVKGEWIETIGTPQYEISFEDRCVVITCKIEGVIREGYSIGADIEILTLKSAPNINFASTEFFNGDDLFLYFKAPVSGYLNVYLINEADDNAFCLLPYKKEDIGSFKVKADEEYFLFSKEKATFNKDVVDEYTLSTESNKEFNELIILFSPSEYNKSNLKLDKNLTIPRYTSYKKFNEWLSKLKSKSNKITCKTITLTIQKR